MESVSYASMLKDAMSGWGTYSSFGHSNIGMTTSYGLNPVYWILPPGYFIPFLLLLSGLQTIFGDWTSSVYIFLGILAPFIGMYYAAHYWFRSYTKDKMLIQWMAFCAAMIYATSSLMSDRIIAAHLRYSFGHALLPVLIMLNIQAYESPKHRVFFTLLSGLAVGIFIWLMPHALLLYIIVIGLYYLIELRNLQSIISLALIGLGSFMIGFLLNIHIWLPAIIFPEPLSYVEDPQYLTEFVYHLSRVKPYSESFLLTSAYDREFLSHGLNRFIELGRFSIIILAGYAFFIIRKQKELFLLCIAAIGIIFSIGVKYPFEDTYRFLYENTFLFKPFREVGKFSILYLLSISLLVPLLILRLKQSHNRFLPLILTTCTLFIIILNPALYSGDFNGSIKKTILPDKYTRLKDFLNKQEGDFRVAVYPNDHTIADYTWYHNVRINPGFNSVFLSVIPLPKDLAVSHHFPSDYQSRYLDVIESHLSEEWAVKRLGMDRVKYLIVDRALPGANQVISKLNTNPDALRIDGVEGFEVYVVKNAVDTHIMQRPVVYFFGEISGLKFLPPDIAVINLGMQDQGLEMLNHKYSGSLVLANASQDDLFNTLLSEYNYSLFPEVRFTENPSNGFIMANNNLTSFTHKGVMYYNPEIVQAVTKTSVSKNISASAGMYKLLISTITFPKQSNDFTVYINDEKLQAHNFRKKQEGQEWLDMGIIELQKDKATVTIQNNQDVSLFIDHFLLIPLEDYHDKKKIFEEVMKGFRVITTPKEMSTLTSDKTITMMSNSYSPHWDICKRKPISMTQNC